MRYKLLLAICLLSLSRLFSMDSFILGFANYSGGWDYSKAYEQSPIATAIYMNRNFLDTGGEFQFITAAIYNEAHYSKELLRVGAKGLILQEESYSIYKDGEAVDPYFKSSFIEGYGGIGINHPFFTTNLDYALRYDGFKELEDRELPPYNITHTIRNDFSSGTASSVMSPLETINGFVLNINSELIYIPDYDSWGTQDREFNHNKDPALNFKISFGYYIDLNSKNNLMVDTAWLRSINPYCHTLYSVGHGSAMDNEHLSGFLYGEIETENSLLTNLKYTYSPLDSLIIYLKYDSLYDFKKNQFYHGSSLGTGIKLPFDIDLQLEGGVGINAYRDSTPGYIFQLTFVRLFKLSKD